MVNAATLALIAKDAFHLLNKYAINPVDITHIDGIDSLSSGLFCVDCLPKQWHISYNIDGRTCYRLL